MGTTYAETFRVRWPDLDFNQHMRNAGYLGYAEDTRMAFLDSQGWSMAMFQSRQLGPVVLEDRMTYEHELRLRDKFTVDIALAAATPDLRRFRIRNTFRTEPDGRRCAVVESSGLWLDLKTRKPIVPPEDLADAWNRVVRTDDFEQW